MEEINFKEKKKQNKQQNYINHKKAKSLTSNNLLLKKKEKDIIESEIDITIDASSILNRIEKKDSFKVERLNQENLNNRLISETNINHNEITNKIIKFLNDIGEQNIKNEIQNTNDDLKEEEEEKNNEIEVKENKNIKHKENKKKRIKSIVYILLYLFILTLIFTLYIFIHHR